MLSREEVKSYYDRFGRKQDSQAFYEDPATDLLIEHGRFETAHTVFEFGIGTGRFAEKILTHYAPDDCRYHGIDISPTMVDIATERLQSFTGRTTVELASGQIQTGQENGSYDRFVSNFVADLLPEDDAMLLIAEAHRILKPGGLLCMASLSHGRRLFPRVVSAIWSAVYKVNAGLVGGCRPIELSTLVSERVWQTEYTTTVVAFGLTSEVLVARRT